MRIGSDGNRGRGKARRRRGRRLLMVRLLLLLGRFFCRLLRCFLLCHEQSTSLRCQSMDPFTCCISDFVHRVKCLPSGFLRSEWARTPIRDFDASSIGKGFCDSKMRKLYDSNHDNSSMFFARIKRQAKCVRNTVACLIELWVCRDGMLFRVVGQ
jgi:hypothetical protein